MANFNNKFKKSLKELCIEYDTCDSLTRRSFLSEAIVSLVTTYLNKQYSNTYSGMRDMRDTVFDTSDYLPERGHISIYKIYEDKVSVNYYNSWAHEGLCNEVFYIKFEDFENFNEKIFINSLKEQKKASIKFKIESLENVISSLKTQLHSL